MLTWIILIVIAAVALYAVVLFNRLVRTRQMANEAWSGIDVQLKRRSDLVPNLVDTVKGYAAHERNVLDEVTQLRGAARARAERRRRRPRPGRRRAVARARPAVRGGRELSRPEGEQQFPRPAAAVERAGRRNPDGAALLQRHRAQSEHAGAVVPQQSGRRTASASRERAYFEISDEAERAVPRVSLAPAQPSS